MGNWALVLPGFCESVGTGPPEYFNSISSVFILFYGMMGLFVSQNNNILIRVISGSLAFTGIGSAIYHWTLYNGWGHTDGQPMLIASYLGAFQSIDLIIYKKLALDNNSGRRKYEMVSGAMAFLFLSGLCLSLAIEASDDTTMYFTYTFVIPELIIAISCMIIRFGTHANVTTEQNADIGLAFKYMWFGMGYSITAAAFWIITENTCKLPGMSWEKWLFAHPIWHLGISAGMYCLMQFLVFIYSYNLGFAPYFMVGTTQWERIFYTVVPAVNLANDPIAAPKEIIVTQQQVSSTSNSVVIRNDTYV